MKKTTHTTTHKVKRRKTSNESQKGIDYDAAIGADGLSVYCGKHTYVKVNKKSLKFKIAKEESGEPKDKFFKFTETKKQVRCFGKVLFNRWISVCCNENVKPVYFRHYQCVKCKKEYYFTDLIPLFLELIK